MKRMKKILALALALCMIAGLSGCKSEKNVLSVTSAEVAQGEEVTVYITATDETPVAAFAFNVYYNTEELTCTDYGKTEEFEKAWTGMDVFNDTETEDGKKAVIFAGVDTKESEEMYKGKLYYMTFKAVGESGTEAELTFDISALEDISGEEKIEEYTVKNGLIKIK